MPLMRRTERVFLQLWQWLWPQVPIGLFMVAAGATNVLSGFQAQHFLGVTAGTLPQFGQQVSVGVLGHGAQIIFGFGLVLTGLGLFWRVRVAWALAVMLLLITIAINVVGHHFGTALILPLIVLLWLFATQRRFSRRTLLGDSLISLVGIFAVMAYGTFGIYLLGKQFDPQITSMMTAFYFLIETLSTTGYGDYHPVTHLAQGFIITVWVFGLGVFGAALTSIAGSALSNHLNRFLTPGGIRRMQKNHVILIGGGIFSDNTAHELERRGIDFVQVVDQEQESPLPDRPTVFGDTSDERILNKAGIHKARILVAAEDDDGENAFITLVAKDLNPELRVLAVAASRRSIRRLKLAGADTVFAPAEVGGRLLTNLVEGVELPAQFHDLLKEDSA